MYIKLEPHPYVHYLLNSFENYNELLEKKANFLFSVISIFIGGIFFQFEKIASAIIILNKYSLTVRIALYGGGAMFLFGIGLSTFFILNSIKLRNFMLYWPVEPLISLFSPQSKLFPKKESEEDFYDEIGEILISRLENNHIILKKKQKMLYGLG